MSYGRGLLGSDIGLRRLRCTAQIPCFCACTNLANELNQFVTILFHAIDGSILNLRYDGHVSAQISCGYNFPSWYILFHISLLLKSTFADTYSRVLPKPACVRQYRFTGEKFSPYGALGVRTTASTTYRANGSCRITVCFSNEPAVCLGTSKDLRTIHKEWIESSDTYALVV